MKTLYHVLPNELDGDTSWFDRQNAFEQSEIHRQVAFKRKHWSYLANGKFAKLPQHTYPHILPEGCELLAFYPPIAKAALDYFEEEKIALHTEALNLKSSQVACLNFLFPLRQDLELAARLFKPYFPGITRVEKIDFEYTAQDEGATEWLGEPAGGMRGQNRTSIDAAIFWKNERGQSYAALIEWKYTERNFGVCSAFTGGSKAEQERCNLLDVTNDPHPEKSCILTSGKRHCSRRYWEHMAQAGIDSRAFDRIKGCPFQGPFYQLLRQFLLAAYLRQSQRFDTVEVLSIGFRNNTALRAVPPQLKPLQGAGDETVIDLWNKALVNVPPMRHIFVDELAMGINEANSDEQEWRNYLRERYGV